MWMMNHLHFLVFSGELIQYSGCFVFTSVINNQYFTLWKFLEVSKPFPDNFSYVRCFIVGRDCDRYVFHFSQAAISHFLSLQKPVFSLPFSAALLRLPECYPLLARQRHSHLPALSSPQSCLHNSVAFLLFLLSKLSLSHY